MDFLRSLNPFASTGVEDTENYTPKPNAKSVGFRNNVKVKNFALGNAPSNVRTTNTRNASLTNNRKNTRKMFARGLGPRIKPQARANFLNYSSKINTQRRFNNFRKTNANRRNRNVASSRNPSGEQWLRERQPQFKFPAGILGYSNTVNNLTRKAYKPISNLSQKQAQNWAAKVHTNEVFGR